MISKAPASGAPATCAPRRRGVVGRVLSSPLVRLGLRLLLGGVFVWASVDKIQHPSEFARGIYNYRLLPVPLVNLMAITMPWIEAMAGLLVIAGLWVRSAALVLAVLLGVFILAIAEGLARGLDITCGCFSVSAQGSRLSWDLLLRDLALLAVGIYLIRSLPSCRPGREPST